MLYAMAIAMAAEENKMKIGYDIHRLSNTTPFMSSTPDFDAFDPIRASYYMVPASGTSLSSRYKTK